MAISKVVRENGTIRKIMYGKKKEDIWCSGNLMGQLRRVKSKGERWEREKKSQNPEIECHCKTGIPWAKGICLTQEFLYMEARTTLFSERGSKNFQMPGHLYLMLHIQRWIFRDPNNHWTILTEKHLVGSLKVAFLYKVMSIILSNLEPGAI